MALVKISALPAATSLTGTETVPVVQGGVTRQASIGMAVPAGCVQMYGGSAAPTGWLLCDGSAVSRTTYATLFAVLGTTFGAGNGSTTFNLPDMRGRVAVGAGTGAGLTARTQGQTGGSESMGYTIGPATSPTPGAATVLASASYEDVETTLWPVKVYATGSGSANMQPFVVLNHIIKT